MNMQETWAPAAKKEEGEEESYEGTEANVCDLPVELKWVIGTESGGGRELVPWPGWEAVWPTRCKWLWLAMETSGECKTHAGEEVGIAVRWLSERETEREQGEFLHLWPGRLPGVRPWNRDNTVRPQGGVWRKGWLWFWTWDVSVSRSGIPGDSWQSVGCMERVLGRGRFLRHHWSKGVEDTKVGEDAQKQWVNRKQEWPRTGFEGYRLSHDSRTQSCGHLGEGPDASNLNWGTWRVTEKKGKLTVPSAAEKPDELSSEKRSMDYSKRIPRTISQTSGGWEVNEKQIHLQSLAKSASLSLSVSITIPTSPCVWSVLTSPIPMSMSDSTLTSTSRFRFRSTTPSTSMST